MRLAHGSSGYRITPRGLPITAERGGSPRRCCVMGATARVDTVTRLRQKASDRWRFPERTLHVVDIENLAGAPIPSLIQVNAVQDWYMARLGFGADDQVVMASSHLTFLNAALGWPHARYRVRSGPNGADHELLDVLEHEDVAARFGHVVIGSGDWRFTRAAVSLAERGVRVTVVSRRGSLAVVLARAAQNVVYLDIPRAAAA